MRLALMWKLTPFFIKLSTRKCTRLIGLRRIYKLSFLRRKCRKTLSLKSKRISKNLGQNSWRCVQAPPPKTVPPPRGRDSLIVFSTLRKKLLLKMFNIVGHRFSRREQFFIALKKHFTKQKFPWRWWYKKWWSPKFLVSLFRCIRLRKTAINLSLRQVLAWGKPLFRDKLHPILTLWKNRLAELLIKMSLNKSVVCIGLHFTQVK